MTSSDHIERELALFKLRVADGDAGKLAIVLEQFDARVLSDTQDQYTVEVASGDELTAWVQNIADGANVPVGRVRLSWAREHTFAVLPQEGVAEEEEVGE